MELSIFLAKAVGLYLLIVGIALFKNPAYFVTISKKFSQESIASYVATLFAITVGILIILTHNIWVLDWRLLITLLGWITFIKGTTLLLFPRSLDSMIHWSIEKLNFRIFGAVYATLGLFLCLKGYFVV